MSEFSSDFLNEKKEHRFAYNVSASYILFSETFPLKEHFPFLNIELLKKNSKAKEEFCCSFLGGVIFFNGCKPQTDEVSSDESDDDEEEEEEKPKETLSQERINLTFITWSEEITKHLGYSPPFLARMIYYRKWYPTILLLKEEYSDLKEYLYPEKYDHKEYPYTKKHNYIVAGYARKCGVTVNELSIISMISKRLAELDVTMYNMYMNLKEFSSPYRDIWLKVYSKFHNKYLSQDLVRSLKSFVKEEEHNKETLLDDFSDVDNSNYLDSEEFKHIESKLDRYNNKKFFCFTKATIQDEFVKVVLEEVQRCEAL